MKKYSLGLDIGGTKCAVVLGKGEIPCSTADGFILAKKVFPTVQSRGWRAVIDEFFVTIDSVLAENKVVPSQLIGIGVSCGGPLDSRTGVVKCPPNLPDWDDVPVVKLLESRYGVRAFIQNDANACAVAEWKFGAGRGLSNVVFLTFGTGMGAGLILDGRLYSGTNDMAGEVGHIRLAEDGPEGYGKRGSFEGFCSGGGIARIARGIAEKAFEHGGSVGFCKSAAELDSISAKTVADAAYCGDPAAIEVYRTCAKYLGRGLSVIVDMLNPQAVVIGSIYARSLNLLEAAAKSVMLEECLSLSLGVCKVLPAELGNAIGDYAALGVAFSA